MKSVAVAATKRKAECENIKFQFRKEQERQTAEAELEHTLTRKKSPKFRVVKRKPKNLDTLQNKAFEAANKYKSSIKQANERQDIYWEDNIKEVFTSLETLERNRIDILNKQMHILYQTYNQTHTENTKFIENLKQGTPIDVEGDLEMYTKERINVIGMPSSRVPFTYQFQFDPEEIKAGKMFTPDSNFFCTLRRLMERQQSVDPTTKELIELAIQLKGPGGLEIKDRSYHLKTYPQCFLASDFVTWLKEHDIVKDRKEGIKKGQEMINRRLVTHSADKQEFEDGSLFYRFKEDMSVQDSSTAKLTVPIIYMELASHIKQLGGYETEGIFRVPVETNILNKHKEDMENGNYSLKGETNPHAAACMLKMWLRLLAEPLFPDELYDEAIKIGMNKENDHSEVLKLFKRIDIHHKNLITQLAQLSVEVSSNEKVTKMSLDNLGVIFAPAFLEERNLDPQVVMENSKYRANFTAAVFKALAWAFKTKSAF